MLRAIFLIFLPTIAAAAGRVTLILDGTWEVEESKGSTEIPESFSRRGPVPGLTNLARPGFPDVDLFDSRELIDNRIRRKQLPESARVTTAGVSRQSRDYFWYRTTFRPPAARQVAILRVGKAQFGTAVWLNGKAAGEHHGCFTAGYFNLTPYMNWQGENVLLVRIGAHPGVLPPSVPAGTDFEKLKWTPGIYDSVAVLLSDNPVIETVQVAPRLASGEILVETRLRNYGRDSAAVSLGHRVKTWREQRPVAAGKPVRLTLGPGEDRVDTQRIRIPSPRLWSPEDPFLYVLDSSTGGDSASTRFGMRGFRFDTPTRRAMLN